MMTIGIVMIIIGMIKDDEDDDNLGDGHDCHGKKVETDQTEREISTEQKKWLIQCFSFMWILNFFSIFCDIALLLCGQIKYFLFKRENL